MLWLASGSAHAQAIQPASVWYRSAAGCPDGAEFMQALSARDVAARLAQVGDAIDFVVTLGKADDGHSSGVLERQTQTGTVAIRRVDDPSCGQVADALALTLALAVQGSGPAQSDSAAAAAIAPAPAQGAAPARDSSAAAVEPKAVAPEPAAAPAPPASAELRDDANGRAPSEPRAVQWSLGLHAFAATGLAPDLLPGGSASVEVGWGGGRELWQPALRIGALAGFGSGAEAARDIRVRIVGGRIAGCPLAFGNQSLMARPCLALELGQIHGEAAGAGGGSASGLWAASEAAARLSLRASAGVSLEAELGLLLPWTRYELQLASEGTVVDRMAALGVAARLGAVLQFL